MRLEEKVDHQTYIKLTTQLRTASVLHGVVLLAALGGYESVFDFSELRQYLAVVPESTLASEEEFKEEFVASKGDRYHS